MKQILGLERRSSQNKEGGFIKNVLAGDFYREGWLRSTGGWHVVPVNEKAVFCLCGRGFVREVSPYLPNKRNLFLEESAVAQCLHGHLLGQSVDVVGSLDLRHIVDYLLVAISHSHSSAV